MADPQPDPIAEHAELIGRVSMAWNSIQYVIFLLFTKLSGLTAEKAEAVFFTLKADSAQRDITAKVGAVALASNPALLEQFTDLMKEIGKLAGERNAATHTMWEIEKTSGQVGPTPGVPKHGSLQTDFAKQFRELEATLLQRYADLVALQGLLP